AAGGGTASPRPPPAHGGPAGTALRGGQLLDLDVAEGHLVVGPVVLQADVAVLPAAGGVGVGGVGCLDSVQEDLEPFTLDLDLVAVPLPRGPQHLVAGLEVGRLEAVDGAGGAVGRVGGVDLDLVALVHRGPGVVGGREAHEDTGVVVAV